MVMVGFSTNWRISTFGFHARILIFLREFHWADIELSFSKSDNFSLNIFPRSLSDPYQMFFEDNENDDENINMDTKKGHHWWQRQADGGHQTPGVDVGQNPICSGLYIGKRHWWQRVEGGEG